MGNSEGGKEKRGGRGNMGDESHTQHIHGLFTLLLLAHLHTHLCAGSMVHVVVVVV